MVRIVVLLLVVAMAPLGAEASAAASEAPASVTFHEDVRPVLEKNCQSCHRPGSIAPMSLLTYEAARPWAKAIKAAVVNGKMPPWFADPHYGEFRNAPKLTQAEVDTLAAWADTGAREGDTAPASAPAQWPEGWRIQPDVVVAMAEPYRVAAKGAGEIREFFVENPFKEDTWISSIEIRPGDPAVVHHVIVQVPETLPPTAGVKFKCADCQIAEVLGNGASAFQNVITPNSRASGGGSYSDPEFVVRRREMETGRGVFTTMEAVYAPGTSPLDFRFTDSAKLIRGGKPIRIEVHYTPNGKETTDITRIGFTLAKPSVHRQFVIMAPEHMADTSKPIPAGTASWETVGELTFSRDAELAWFMPHMHLRGKDMTFRLIFPDGREETVLSAKFNFNWQLGYELAKPIKLPKGTRMVVTSHHDNSANNPMNPTPGQAVGWGEMTEREMMLPWFGVVVEGGSAQPDDIAAYRPPNLGSSFGGDFGFGEDFTIEQ